MQHNNNNNQILQDKIKDLITTHRIKLMQFYHLPPSPHTHTPNTLKVISCYEYICFERKCIFATKKIVSLFRYLDMLIPRQRSNQAKLITNKKLIPHTCEQANKQTHTQTYSLSSWNRFLNLRSVWISSNWIQS